ncbi:hypothetical protein L1887_41288 [Cichorium endivia]|nr:hypothetical protein L1887_41288 [Cichorium endivia]
MHLLDKRSTRALPVAAMIHDNSTDRTALVPATHHSNFCPINFRWASLVPAAAVCTGLLVPSVGDALLALIGRFVNQGEEQERRAAGGGGNPKVEDEARPDDEEEKDRQSRSLQLPKDKTKFEKQLIRFAVAAADVVIINMLCWSYLIWGAATKPQGHTSMSDLCDVYSTRMNNIENLTVHRESEETRNALFNLFGKEKLKLKRGTSTRPSGASPPSGKLARSSGASDPSVHMGYPDLKEQVHHVLSDFLADGHFEAEEPLQKFWDHICSDQLLVLKGMLGMPSNTEGMLHMPSNIEGIPNIEGMLGMLSNTEGMLEGMLGHTASMLEGKIGDTPSNIEGMIGSVPSLLEGTFGATPSMLEDMLGSAPSMLEGTVGDSPSMLEGMLGYTPSMLEGMLGYMPSILEGMLGKRPSMLEGVLGNTPSMLEGMLGNTPSMLERVLG